jgi:plastocyanin
MLQRYFALNPLKSFSGDFTMFKNIAAVLLTVIVSFSALNASAQEKANPCAAKVKVIELIQTPGKFENEKLTLKPGKYQFKVTNKGIDHEVAFYLQKADKNAKPISETPVKSSELAKHVKNGETSSSGTVDLAKGTYVYSCPLNPTPHYVITVK